MTGEGTEPDTPVSESVARNGKPEIERNEYREGTEVDSRGGII
jgi:hypothetical protein